MGEGVFSLAADPALPENRVWENPLLAENSRQGFAPLGSTLHLGFEQVNSRTALGMRPTLYDEGIRSRCTGKERDTETGLDYFGARYYASNMGRFMSPDPLMASAFISDPQSWNRYTYTRNNPLKFIDPDGMKEISPEDCAKTKACVVVQLNLIVDKNADLTQKQIDEFKNNEVQRLKDEFGSNLVSFKVTQTEGEVSSKDGKITDVVGAKSGAMNLVLTDNRFFSQSAASGVINGKAVAMLNANADYRGDAGHEITHILAGHSTSFLAKATAWAYNKGGMFGGALVGLPANVWYDTVVGVARTVPLGYPYTDINMAARRFAAPTDQKAIRPTQK